jgi:hypothetical protein
MRPILLCTLLLFAAARAAPAADLPLSTRFKGETQFHQLLQRAYDNHWAALPIGPRTAAIGRALVGTPYLGFTLEIDDHIEAPSANFTGLDCWTFFEIALATARLLDEPREFHTPEGLLKYIELDRYRGGKCDGTYLSRLHYLEEWSYDNDRRGLVREITDDLGGQRYRNVCVEMTRLWKSYRYLRNNPELRGPMAEHERRIEKLPTWMIPKSKVAAIEDQLQNGDIIGIISRDPPLGYSTSHVGLVWRDDKGVPRFIHATTQRDLGRRVAVDSRLSSYLNRFSSHAGILVCRPQPVPPFLANPRTP